MLETGVLLLFLVPGLAAYAAIYGLFHSGKAIAPEPPSANTVEAVVIIAGASIAVHALTAFGFALNVAICREGCPVGVPRGWLDPYGAALGVTSGGTATGSSIAFALGGIAVQGAATYVATQFWLRWCARRDALPAWIYGWARDLANSADNEETFIIAYVLTTAEHQGRSIVYGGGLQDMALKPDGCVSRITLYECERYLADLGAPLPDPTLPEPLSRFPFMIIDAENIRNVAFETLDLGRPSAPRDLLGDAMIALRKAGDRLEVAHAPSPYSVQ